MAKKKSGAGRQSGPQRPRKRADPFSGLGFEDVRYHLVLRQPDARTMDLPSPCETAETIDITTAER